MCVCVCVCCVFVCLLILSSSQKVNVLPISLELMNFNHGGVLTIAKIHAERKILSTLGPSCMMPGKASDFYSQPRSISYLLHYLVRVWIVFETIGLNLHHTCAKSYVNLEEDYEFTWNHRNNKIFCSSDIS